MHKKPLSAVIIGLSLAVASSSYASTLLNKLGLGKQTLIESNKDIADGPFTDFSGRWDGYCVDSGGNQSRTVMNIRNTAAYFSVFGDEGFGELYTIGSYLSQSESSAKGNIDAHFLLNWIGDGKVLSMESTNVTQLASQPLTLFTQKSKGTFTLLNDQLFISSSTFSDSSNATYSYNCSLNRVP